MASVMVGSTPLLGLAIRVARPRVNQAEQSGISAVLGGAPVNARPLASYGLVIVSEQTEHRPTPGSVRLSAHAVEQYRRRVKAGLELDAARVELERLVGVGELTAVEPAWVNAARAAPYYLVLADACALPLHPVAGGWVATTCVANLTLTSVRRAAKSARHGSLGAEKRAQRRARR